MQTGHGSPSSLTISPHPHSPSLTHSPPPPLQSEQLLDARSEGRFKGTEPEPRPGLRGGHIPGAKNVPFDTVLMHSGAMRKAGDVAAMLASARIDKDRPITGEG